MYIGIMKYIRGMLSQGKYLSAMIFFPDIVLAKWLKAYTLNLISFGDKKSISGMVIYYILAQW